MAEKTRMRFSILEDLILLRKVVDANPFKNPEKWIDLHDNFNVACGKLFTLRSFREHAEYLLKLYIKEDWGNLRKSGNVEQYQEKERLLKIMRQISDEAKAHRSTGTHDTTHHSNKEASKQQDTDETDHCLEVDVKPIISSVNESLCDMSTESIPSNAVSTERRTVLEVSTVIERFSPDTSSSESSEATPEVANCNAGSSSGVTPRKRKFRSTEEDSVLGFLGKKQELDRDVRMKELEIEERKLKLEQDRLELESQTQQRKLKLEEERFALEKEERLRQLVTQERKEEEAKKTTELQFGIMGKLLDLINNKL